MKIAYIFAEITIMGGTDKVLVQKANYLAAHGHEVTIITESQMGRPTSFPLDSRVRHIDMGLDFNRQYTQDPLRRALTYFTLMRQYRQRLSEVLNQLRADIVVTTLGRSLDFLTSLNDGSVKIGEAHTTKEHMRSLHLMKARGGLYSWVADRMRSKMYRNASRLKALVLLTQNDAASWAGTTRTVIIPNSLPAMPATCSQLNSKQAIMVGRYNDAKGYDYLIASWQMIHQRHPDWTLNVYGSGELHDQVVDWIRQRNLQDTIVLHEPTSQIMEKYLESSVCLITSRYEGFSMVILEAMASGVPCVSFDCPHGPRTIIRNGEDGILVDYLNTQAFADAVCRVIEDEALRKRLGENARRNIGRFSQDAVMKQWTDLFQQLIR